MFREIGGFLDFDKDKAAPKSDALDPHTSHYSRYAIGKNAYKERGENSTITIAFIYICMYFFFFSSHWLTSIILFRNPDTSESGLVLLYSGACKGRRMQCLQTFFLP